MSAVEPGQKSLFTAYLCWLFGGIYGLHHIYLGRDDHAFITFATFGGYFTAGLWRDLWRMPEYVKDANNDLEYLEQLHKEMRLSPEKPSSSLVRQSSLMMVGNLFAYLTEYAIPQELLDDTLVIALKFLLTPCASAFGVWLAGNVGRHQGDLKKPLIVAYLTAIPSLFYGINPCSFSTLAATIVFNRYSRGWRHERRPPKHIAKRLAVLSIAVSVYLALWTSGIYYSCSLQDPETGEPIKCRDAIYNFFHSQAVTDLSEALWTLFEQLRYRGFAGLWREIVQELDFSGKSNAAIVLGVADDAPPEEILAAYKKLSRQYHPDREKDPDKKAEMHERFIEVQAAYKKLQPTYQRPRKDEL